MNIKCSYGFDEVENKGKREYHSYFGWGRLCNAKDDDDDDWSLSFVPDELRCKNCQYHDCPENETA